MLLAGVDVGGTNIGVGLVGDDHQVHHRAKEDTPTSVDALVAQVSRMVRSLDGTPEAVGIGIPGIIHDDRVVQAPNLEGWTAETDVAAQLSADLGVPVSLVNDAQCGLVGEWVAGAGQGSDFLFGVWLGTGVGAGMVLDGKGYDGANGGSGEFGHLVVRPGGARCGCGRRGCIEAYAGRRMMTESARALAAAGRKTSLFEHQEERGKAKATSGVWAAALAEGDRVVTEILDEAVAALGIGVANVCNLLDVDRVVVGGGMAGKLGQPFADRIAAAARPHAVRKMADSMVVVAGLGDDSGVVGAAEIARGRLG
ncbi:ROK family protein [Aquihabitans sp. G128]|uniref:ROK family protein n=1 Tax=Aquihabitans sp. G128 TaxID=2849779 RepID=UPI001C23B79A|nr:ROK family protein [Aquihabitans sp. G128]QXC62551.1 ROK family protein [Aquihabitans sp. G128]